MGKERCWREGDLLLKIIHKYYYQACILLQEWLKIVMPQVYLEPNPLYGTPKKTFLQDLPGSSILSDW